MGDREIRALIDTGASDNVLHPELTTNRIRHTWDKATAACQDGDMQIKGTTKLTFSINGTQYSDSFYVIDDLRFWMILGIKWLRKHQTLFDVSRGCLHIGQSERQIVHLDNCSKKKKQKFTAQIPNVSHLPSAQAKQLKSLLMKYEQVFVKELHPAGANVQHHKIQLQDLRPVRIRPRKYTPEKLQIIQEQVEELLQNRLIEPASSPYSSPIHIVEKKGGKSRFCIDYRELNSRTMDGSSQLPPISETIRDLGEAKVFTTLDLASGYWQIPMDAAARPLTAFTTPDGDQYQWRVMPFGLKMAPNTFQQAMNRILAGYLNKFTKVYLDDIIIFSNSMEEHMEHLEKVLERLLVHRLRATPDKCQMATATVDYLGYTINGDTTLPQKHHLEKLATFRRPTSRKETQKFLGTLNWLRDFLPDLATIAAPITSLTEAKRMFRWTPEADAAWVQIQDLLQEPLQLKRPNTKKPFILQTDSSDYGMGAVLFQLDDDGGKRIVSYASCKLRQAEKRYHSNEKECLALVWAIKRYRPYLETAPFTLRTDNRALQWLANNRDAKAKFMRWSLLLAEFSFSIEHVPGRQNELPDFLSRNPIDDETPKDLEEPTRLCPPTVQIIETTPLVSMVQQAQEEDQVTQGLIQNLQRILRNGPEGDNDRLMADEYRLSDEGHLYYKDPREALWKIYVPEHNRKAVIKQLHVSVEAAHPGSKETIRAARERCHWPQMAKEIRSFVRRCVQCRRAKGWQRQPKAPMTTHLPRSTWDVISVDCLGPYPSTAKGPKFAVIVEDVLTKWVEIKAVHRITTKIITNFLEELLSRYGVPRQVITDYGPQFRSRAWTRFLRTNEMEHTITAVEHQRANPVERRIQVFKQVMRSLLHNKPAEKWSDHLDKAAFVMRTRENRATGETPAKAFLGREIQHPGDWKLPRDILEPAENREAHDQRLVNRRTRFMREYVKNAQGPTPQFQPNQRVLVRNRNQHPFQPLWTGPCTVEQKTSNNTYKILQNGGLVLVHADDIRPIPNEEAEAE